MQNPAAVPLYLVCLLAAATSITLGIVAPIGFLWFRRRKNIRLPGKDRMLRPAGESLRVKIEGLNENLMFALMSIILYPLLVTLGLAYQGLWNLQLPAATAYSTIIISAITGAGGGIYLARLGNRLANHNLGFLGERLVGEALSALQAERCRVFHDIPLDGPANLDHVLVTPTAVFAIETKMRRRKRVQMPGQPIHRVRYDGERIHFPFGSDTFGLNQARRNARWLSEFLTKANAAEVPVTAVLVLPQWEVHRVARGDVTVVSHKELKALARFQPREFRRLEPAEIERICFALSERAMCDGL